MHRSQESAEVRWLRAHWTRYYLLRRCYLWAAKGFRTFAIWVRGRASRVAHWILDYTDPLAKYQRQRQQFLAFYDRYEQLVDVLCWAARDTVHDGCDEQYREIRGWLMDNYAPMRRALEPFIQQALAESDHNTRQDPFEMLFAPEHVMQVIEQDDGDLLGRIILTRDIVARYDAHLRSKLDKHGRQVTH